MGYAFMLLGFAESSLVPAANSLFGASVAMPNFRTRFSN